MTESVSKPATGAKRPVPRLRRILYSLVPLLILLAVLEGVAWIVDSRTRFRARLLDRLALMVVENQPIRDDVELNWPDGSLQVRAASEREVPDQPHAVGGRMILEAMRPPTQEFIYPEGIPRDGRKRVFIVGGSAAFGYPYAYPKTFAGRLGSRLKGRGFHVVNASQTGCSSGRLVPIARRIVRQFEPDWVAILVGNNEWFQWYPDGQNSLSVDRVRVMQVCAHSRALAALECWMLRNIPVACDPADEEEDGFRPHRQLSGSSYALEHPLELTDFDPQHWLGNKSRFLEAFEDNLTEMVRLAHDRGVRVILMTVPFNYRLSPGWKHPQPWWFDAEHREALIAAHREVGRLVSDGRLREAIPRIDAALALDPLPPLLHYMLGQCLEGLGEPLAAEEAYAQCREHMIGNLGGRLSITESIARVAAANDVLLIDVKQLFDSYSHEHERWFNEDLIHDDCHPTPKGHRIIADALERALAE